MLSDNGLLMFSAPCARYPLNFIWRRIRYKYELGFLVSELCDVDIMVLYVGDFLYFLNARLRNHIASIKAIIGHHGILMFMP